MRKFLTALGVAAFLSVSFWVPIAANAAVVEHTVAGGMDAAGEVSATLTVPGGTELTIFTFGTYSAANRFELQEEVGSPGSGAFSKVLRLDDGTANAFITNTWLTGPNRTAYRVFMTVAGTGDVMVQMTDRASAAIDYGTVSTLAMNIYFDDFNTNTSAINAAFYVSDTEADDGTDEPFLVLDTEVEGAVFGEAGGGGDGTDATCMSALDFTDWAGLVSDGPMFFEVRLRTPDTTGSVSMALTEVECVAAPIPHVDIDSGVVVFATGTYQDSVGIDQHGDATNLLSWIPWAANNDVEQFDGAAAGDGDEISIGTLAADTYVVLRVETDTTGDCYFYVDGVLKAAHNTCVATDSLLNGYIHIDSTVDGAGVTDVLYADYWYFGFSRPATP